MQFWDSSKKPSVVKIILWITASLSILYPILTYFLLSTFGVHNFGLLLPLSWMGIKQGFFWQPISYLFVHSVGTSFTLGFLISLFFLLFLFWFTASELATRYGALKFTLFYLGAGAFSGLVATAYFLLFNKLGVLVGSSPAVYALITVWGMLNPYMRLHLFMFLQVQAKWLVLILLGISLFFNLIGGGFAYVVADIAGILFGFGIGHFVWKLPNPYFGR
ncbi:MAG: hypothetical protein S4CHLAM81_01410 [Chlamydiales bacterium]|nr:hypothetical protein [Chlamydiales bacterium]MCH9634937.1 hypothetical protein [Chlamydiales bacterium]